LGGLGVEEKLGALHIRQFYNAATELQQALKIAAESLPPTPSFRKLNIIFSTWPKENF
jgi:hypothetical protein